MEVYKIYGDEVTVIDVDMSTHNKSTLNMIKQNGFYFGNMNTNISMVITDLDKFMNGSAAAIGVNTSHYTRLIRDYKLKNLLE